jgi:hypothetical protein
VVSSSRLFSHKAALREQKLQQGIARLRVCCRPLLWPRLQHGYRDLTCVVLTLLC